MGFIHCLHRALAAPAVLIMNVGQGVFRGLQDVKTPLAITVATNLLHLALTPLFMFPMSMGLQGAALSTTLSEWLAASAYVVLMWGQRQALGLSPPPKPADVWRGAQEYAPFVRAGGAVLMRTGVLLGTKTFAMAVASRMGPVAVASHQILLQVGGLVLTEKRNALFGGVLHKRLLPT